MNDGRRLQDDMSERVAVRWWRSKTAATREIGDANQLITASQWEMAILGVSELRNPW